MPTPRILNAAGIRSDCRSWGGCGSAAALVGIALVGFRDLGADPFVDRRF